MKGNLLSGNAREQQHQKRLDYLRSRPDLLVRLPGIGNDVHDAESAALDEALKAMKFLRLYAATADAQNARWSIRLLVSELRGQVTARGLRVR